MNNTYDNYYHTENLFGAPYPELLLLFKSINNNLKVLDVGCGQGRDAIAIAQLGFEVTGIDNSAVGIEQLNQATHTKGLKLKGLVEDIYTFTQYSNYDVILLDSMFHFLKKDRTKEVRLIEQIFTSIKPLSLVIFCIQDTKQKVKVLLETIDNDPFMKLTHNIPLIYCFRDDASGHSSETPYRIVLASKKPKNKL